MKELRSRKYPNHRPQLLTDDEYKTLKEKGLASRFIVTEIKPMRSVIPSAPVLKKEETKEAPTKKSKK